MKNQWFGDEYDYRKYALLRFLSGYYDNILVSWMLTSDAQLFGMDIPDKDNPMRDTARFILRHRKIDFVKEFLEEKTSKGKFVYWDKEFDLVEDKQKETEERQSKRVTWKEQLNKQGEIYEIYKERSIYFFDADNGYSFEEKKEEEKDCKYVYKDDISPLFDNGADILLYQHRPRAIKFDTMISNWKVNILDSSENIIRIKATGNVAFLLLLHTKPDKNTIINDFCDTFSNPDFMSIV